MAFDIVEMFRRMVTLPKAMNSLDDFYGQHPGAKEAFAVLAGTTLSAIADAVAGAAHSITSFGTTELDTAQNLLIMAVKGALTNVSPTIEAGLEAAIRAEVTKIEHLATDKIAETSSAVVAAAGKVIGAVTK